MRAALLRDAADATIFAVLQIAHEGRLVEVDSRPSDAIAFAIAADAPILINETLLTSPDAQPWPPPRTGVG